MSTIHHLHAWKGSLQLGDKGPKKNMTNLMMHLDGIPELGQSIRFNELTQQVEWREQPFDEMTDQIAIRLILDEHKFEPAKGDLWPAILAHARKNTYHPVREYLSGLRWDNIPRLDTWLTMFMGADDTPFTRLAGRKTLIAAVARAMEPGCKVDTMLILEGEQGVKKSSAIEAIFSKRFYMASVDLFKSHADMVMAMMGAWVVELPEFTAVLRRDPKMVKGLMSISVDKIRRPYDKGTTEHPRHSITIATYNPEEDDEGYLEDTTGNRRYWPVRVSMADLDGIKKYRDQIWAEAYKAFIAGEHWWLNDDDEAKLARETTREREGGDVWADILEPKLIDKNRLSYSDVYEILCLPIDRINSETKGRVRRVMRQLGYKFEPRNIGHKKVRLWCRFKP